MPGRDLMDEALEARAAGLSVMPVNAGGLYDKRPHLVLMETGHRRPKEGVPGRWVPAWQPLMDTPATDDMIAVWFRRPLGKGLAFVTGRCSERIVIDLDGPAGDALRILWNIQPHVRTGSGGWHLHLPAPAWRVPTLNGKSARALGQAYPGLDIRGDGGYAILPPTVSCAGPYSWARPLAELDDLAVLPLPARVMLGLIEPVTRPSSIPKLSPRPPVISTPLRSADWAPAIDEAVQRAHAGLGRNATGFWLACRLRDLGGRVEDVKAIAFDRRVPPHNTKGEPEPYTAREWAASVDSAFTQPAWNPPPKPAPVSVMERLTRLWPTLGDGERALAVACIVASRGVSATTLAELSSLGVSADAVAQAARTVAVQRQLGLFPPGLTALANRLLPAWQGVDGRTTIGHTEPHQRD
ncbi:bifunctional DNA primase/polymerase [Deinococcus sp. HMF7604]|uniref:bifunctional DNA primase/polymerase n=1 Tax=Deinococcus TaxID=1298 RepID=UPI0018DB72D2|nr:MULTISPECIES: bifunctional DNA primase/polymerase [Deinococcus]MBZ9752187.1 bifunctional DNA primase/polymerase [Deinococcus betulae]